MTTYYRYWAKTTNTDNLEKRTFHLLPYHCLDVAAVGQVILERNRSLKLFFSDSLELEPKSVTGLILYFLAIHDIGKFSDTFQGVQKDLLFHLKGRTSQSIYDIRHDSLGYFLFDAYLANAFPNPAPTPPGLEGIWLDILNILARSFTGHHGQPPQDTRQVVISDYFLTEDIEAASLFNGFCRELFLTKENPLATADPKELKQRACNCSWWLAGFAVLCDWLGSNNVFFKFFPASKNDQPIPLKTYYNSIALPAARAIIDAANFLPVAVTPPASFTHFFPDFDSPTPLQQYAATTELDQGPHLFILEDVTGAGKTEAAFMLLHRLMAAGMAEGAYIGLPTMATANAMYGRIGEVYKKLFAADTAPSLTLAHGARHLMDGFVDSIIPFPQEASEYLPRDESTAENICSGWLADNRKKALLAHMGVGTIDQALLGILCSRHQSLRLLGLHNKVLVVDEVHACDAYMHGLLRCLLTQHAAAGGSAILLSATLPTRMREELLAAFAAGRGYQGPALDQKNAYPLASKLGAEEFNQEPVASRKEIERELICTFLATEDEAFSLIEEKIAQGQCIAWIRNTVGDAIRAYRYLETKVDKSKLTLFHANFSLGDRLDIEKKVIQRFGKKSSFSSRKGQIVIATQVIEQSLDLDFDWLISDLAPIDLLLQRAGRLRRHNRSLAGELSNYRDERGTPEFYILSPAPEKDCDQNWYSQMFDRAAYVYSDHGRLWLTAEYLKGIGRIKIPGDLRTAIETVYGAGSEDRIPRGLQYRSRQADTERRVNSALARMHQITFADGYQMATNQWQDTASAITRLGEPTTTLRLAIWKDGKLSPWYKAQQNSWAFSEINIRRNKAATEAQQNDHELARAVAETKAPWSLRQQTYLLLVPLVEQEEGLWQGHVNNSKDELTILHYSLEHGLYLDDTIPA